MSDDEGIEIELYGDETIRVLVNNNIKMTPGKMAAQAIHAVLMAYGIPHGSVIVLQGRSHEIEKMQSQVHDAGLTEVKPGTLTAGASLSRPEES